jgi:addiction module RelE/StbE family toxin
MNRTLPVSWAASARRDLREILDYIALDSPAMARAKLSVFEESVSELGSFPKKGRIVPELEKNNISTYRELILSPWRVFYKIENQNIFIMAVIDGRRNIEEILLRRQLR